MGDVVNLKRFKKRNEREQVAKQAEARRALFGRTKTERARDDFHAERSAKLLDQHHIDGGEAS
jgi:ribosomal protein S21